MIFNFLDITQIINTAIGAILGGIISIKVGEHFRKLEQERNMQGALHIILDELNLNETNVKGIVNFFEGNNKKEVRIDESPIREYEIYLFGWNESKKYILGSNRINYKKVQQTYKTLNMTQQILKSSRSVLKYEQAKEILEEITETKLLINKYIHRYGEIKIEFFKG